jgi:hypothetical protein
MISPSKRFHKIGGGPTKTMTAWAWEMINGKPYPGDPSVGVRHDVKTKKYRGFEVDKELKNKWLDELNNIVNVEIFALCIGHSATDEHLEWPTYVAFFLDRSIYHRAVKIVKKLRKIKDTKVMVLSMQERRRMGIICAAPFIYKGPKHKEWVDWWESIASRINKAVNG